MRGASADATRGGVRREPRRDASREVALRKLGGVLAAHVSLLRYFFRPLEKGKEGKHTSKTYCLRRASPRAVYELEQRL